MVYLQLTCYTGLRKMADTKMKWYYEKYSRCVFDGATYAHFFIFELHTSMAYVLILETRNIYLYEQCLQSWRAEFFIKTSLSHWCESFAQNDCLEKLLLFAPILPRLSLSRCDLVQTGLSIKNRSMLTTTFLDRPPFFFFVFSASIKQKRRI